ncbi:MAG: transporter associated domain-containing protein [Steroidobacteraceae bacterium]
MSDPEGTTQTMMRRIRRLAAPKDRAQLRDMLKHAALHGLLDTDALSMVEGVLDVADLQVRDIMVPHNQMISVREDDLAPRILSVAIDSGHSRFPVLDADGEKVVGILLAKDLLRLLTVSKAPSFNLRDWMRKPMFVPESKRVNVLLKELRGGRNHMAVAIDEYGSVAGLVTMEDVIEQIVGEIDDEYDVEDEKNIRREDERQFIVRGSTRIVDFNEHFGANFPDDANDTVAGLVTQHFGRLPRRGETTMLLGFEFRVTRADRRRIDALRVTVPASDATSADAVAINDQSG